jgi:hypothetical protein
MRGKREPRTRPERRRPYIQGSRNRGRHRRNREARRSGRLTAGHPPLSSIEWANDVRAGGNDDVEVVPGPSVVLRKHGAKANVTRALRE